MIVILIKKGSFNDLSDTINGLIIKDIIYNVFLCSLLLYKASNSIKKDINDGIKINSYSEIHIMESILDCLKTECNHEIIKKIFLSHEGLEIIFKDELFIKGLDEHKKIAYLPLNNSKQKITNGSLQIEYKHK